MRRPATRPRPRFLCGVRRGKRRRTLRGMLRPYRFPAFVLHILVFMEDSLGKGPKVVHPVSSVQCFQTTNVRFHCRL
ncbi:hypothetical protein NN561_009956 [Cricetulus griseus]